MRTYIRRYPFLIALGVLLCLIWGGTYLYADQEIEKLLRNSLGPKVSIETVEFNSDLGWYEVKVDGRMIYLSESKRFLFLGDIFDLDEQRNITRDGLATQLKESMASLPLDQAIKIVRGNGERVLISFEDPYCGYCRKLAKTLAKMDNLTLHIFMYPVLGERSNKMVHDIWCAPDPALAWSRWMLAGEKPAVAEAATCSDQIVKKNLALGRKLGINGTPFLIFENGEAVPGALPAARLEALLNAAESADAP